MQKILLSTALLTGAPPVNPPQVIAEAVDLVDIDQRKIIIARSQVSGTIHDTQMGVQTITHGMYGNALTIWMHVDPDLPFKDSIGGITDRQILFMANIKVKHAAGADETLLLAGRGLHIEGTNAVAFSPDPYEYDHLSMPRVPEVFGKLLLYKITGQNHSESVNLNWLTKSTPFSTEIVLENGDPDTTDDEYSHYQLFVSVDRNEFLGYKWYSTMQLKWYPYTIKSV